MRMSDEVFLNYLKDLPELRERFESLVMMINDETGQLKEADAVEFQLIEAMRKMGNQSLKSWAECQVKASEGILRKTEKASKNGKKNFTGTQHLVK